MSPIDDHTELQDMLPAASLEMLEPAEMERVMAHIRECAECATLLPEYRDAAAVLPLQLPARPMDAQRAGTVRARLLARARKEQVIPITRKPSWMVYQSSGWLVAAGLTGLLLVHHSVHRPLAYGWLAAGLLVVALLGLGIYSRGQRRRIAELEDRLGGSGPRNRAL